jgi:hypothetical protein
VLGFRSEFPDYALSIDCAVCGSIGCQMSLMVGFSYDSNDGLSRVGAVALYTVLWTVVVEYRKNCKKL